MIYLAHFDFSVEPVTKRKRKTKRATDADVPRHGYFTCLAEADSVEAAMKKFERLLRSLKKKEDVLDGVRWVYLDSCVEVEKMPVKGFLAHCVNYLDETGHSTMSTSVRGYKGTGVSVYMMAPECEAEEDGHEHGADDELESVEPFLELT